MRDTEARRELDLRAAEMDDRLLHLLPETLREFMGVSCVRVRQENGEFLSAYTSGYIGLSACAGNDTGQGPDHFVPHGMTVCVVDVLEAIDIEQDDGQILSVPSGDPEGGFTQVVERAAVVHAGQEVGARKRLGVLLGLLQFVRQRIGTLDEMARDPQRTIGDDHEKYGRDRHQTFRQAVSEREVQRGGKHQCEYGECDRPHVDRIDSHRGARHPDQEKEDHRPVGELLRQEPPSA